MTNTTPKEVKFSFMMMIIQLTLTLCQGLILLIFRLREGLFLYKMKQEIFAWFGVELQNEKGSGTGITVMTKNLATQLLFAILDSINKFA